MVARPDFDSHNKEHLLVLYLSNLYKGEHFVKSS